MPRGTLNLQDPAGLQAVNGVWRFAPGLVPGQPNEGVVSQLEGTPARLADFDDSGWEICPDLTKWHSRGMAFAWYRIRITLPDNVGGRALAGSRMLFETCVDDYGEIWDRRGVQSGTEGRCRDSTCRSGLSSQPNRNRDISTP